MSAWILAGAILISLWTGVILGMLVFLIPAWFRIKKHNARLAKLIATYKGGDFSNN